MSASFARILNLDFYTMDMSTLGALCELRVRPGGWREMNWLPHRCQFHRLGRVTVTINLAHIANVPRHMAVSFWVFDDSVLPHGSSLDFVLSWETARRCPMWMSEAARTDDTSQCFATALVGQTFPPDQASQPDLARAGNPATGSNAAGLFRGQPPSEGFCRVRCPVTPSDDSSDLTDAETGCLSPIGGILRDCCLDAPGTCGRSRKSDTGGGHRPGLVVRIGVLQHSVPPVAPGRVTRSRSSLAPPYIRSEAAAGRVPSRDSAPPAMAAVPLLPPSTPASTRLSLGLPPGALPQLDYPGTPEFEGL